MRLRSLRGAHDVLGIREQAPRDGPLGIGRELAEVDRAARALAGLAQDRRAPRVAVLQIRAGVAIERDGLLDLEVDVLVALRGEVREHDRADADLARDLRDLV